jgi:RNA polymerase-binding transcription factor DksA
MISNRKPISAAMPADVSPYDEQRARQLLQLLAGVRSQETQWMRALRERDSLELTTIGDEGDSALSDEGLELTASLAELAGSRAAAVEDALARFREGRYGVCEDCGEDIPVERLQAVPAAVLCVDCQRGRESESASRHARTDTLVLWTDEKEPAPAAAGASAEPMPEDGNPDFIGEKRKRGRPRSRPRE